MSFLAAPASAATFYVAPTGSDTAPGTSSQPFKTVQCGVNAAQPGDTVSVGAGTYVEEVKTSRSGTATGLITIDGQGTAKISGFTFTHSYVKLQKMNVVGPLVQYQSLVLFGLDAHRNILSDNVIDAADAPKIYGINWNAGPIKPFDSRTGSDNLIENNTVTRVRGTTMINIMGARNIVRNNRLTDCATSDFFRLFGENNVIQGNYCYNNYTVSGLGNHPDFIQTFGNLGHGSRRHIIEGNIIDKIEGGQLSQLEGNLVPEIEDWTFRNNLFMNIDLQASCSIPNIKYYNNVFYKCNTVNGGHILAFGSRSYGGPNDTAKGYNDTVGINYSHGVKIMNNVFLDCGDLTKPFGWYAVSLESQNCAADYNYVAKAGFAAVREDELKRSLGDPGGWDFQKWWEPHGINGGDPKFANIAASDFRLLSGSFLIDKGLAISSITRDFAGIVRPQGTAYDIGAFEFPSGGAPTAVISASPTTLNFGSIQPGTTADLTFTVQNVGGATLTGSATVAAPFSITQGAAYSLTGGQSQTIRVRYSPAAAGSHSQNVTLTGGGGATVSASGSAVAMAAIGVTPSSLTFGSIQPGQTADRTVTVQNTGGGTLTGTASVSAPFSVVSGGSYNLTAGQTQTVTVRYSPLAAGTHSANVVFTGGAGSTVGVSGTAAGVPAIAVTPATLTFAAISMGTSSTQTLTVRNSGTGTLQGSASVGPPFSIASGGSYTLAAGATQSVIVRYAPVTAGSHSQTVTLTGGGGVQVPVSGSAAGVPSISVTPATLSFGAVSLGSSATQMLTVRNTGTASLTGAASVSAPFSVTGGAYTLAPGATQTISVRYTPVAVGTHSQTVALSGGGGTSASATGNATAPPPVVSEITPGGSDSNSVVTGWQTYAGSATQYAGSASDPNSLPLTWQWIYTINGGAETVLLSGTGQVTDASYSYPANSAGSNYVWKLRVSNGYTTGESVLSVGVEAPPSGGPDVSFQAATGAITAPFSTTSNYISQAIQTTEPTEGGRAVYSFNVPRAGKYWIQAQVRTAGDGANSFFLNVDAEPEAPGMIWDIPLTNEFEKRIVSWRGNGTDAANQFTPKFFNLSAGQHQLIIRGRERNTQLSSVSIIKLPDPPQRLRVK